MLCDFCSVCDAAWIYPARDFVFEANRVSHGSQGGWTACRTCSRLIELRDSEGLADRSLATFTRRQQLSKADAVAVLDLLRSLHLAFWASRRGPRRIILE